MTTVNLASPDSVRAVLGVSLEELPDIVLADPIYATRLREDIFDMNDQLLADYATALAASPQSSAQARFVDLTQAYAAYNVAQQCLIALPLFSPLTIKDSKSELTRGADFYKALKDDVGFVLSTLRTRLLTVYPQINPSASAPPAVDRVWAAGVGLSSDPVTGS